VRDVALSVPDLTRANLLDSPSACLDTEALYWLVYATDNPVNDLGAVYDAINAAQPALVALGGATATSSGVAVPVKLLRSAPTCVVDSVVDPLRALNIGTDLTLFGLGIGTHIGGGAALTLTFMVPGDLGGISAPGGVAAATAAAGSEVLATASASGELAANSNRAARIISKTRTAAGGVASSVFGDLKFILIAALVVVLLYFFVQLQKA